MAQAEATASTKTPRQEHIWNVPRIGQTAARETESNRRWKESQRTTDHPRPCHQSSVYRLPIFLARDREKSEVL